MVGEAPHGNDLASILQTLSSFTSPTIGNQTAATRDSSHGSTHIKSYDGSVSSEPAKTLSPEDEEYDPDQFRFAISHKPIVSRTTPVQQKEPIEVFTASETPAERPKSETVREDPRNLVSWPAALRYTTKLINESPAVGQRIRSLIENQRSNEQQWWTGRQNLIEKQKARVDGRAQIQQVLRSIGAAKTSEVSEDESRSENKRLEDEANELHTYDLKVHRLMGRVGQEQEKELAAVGVPFFVLRDEADCQIAGVELEKLREKMVAFLEEFVQE